MACLCCLPVTQERHSYRAERIHSPFSPAQLVAAQSEVSTSAPTLRMHHTLPLLLQTAAAPCLARSCLLAYLCFTLPLAYRLPDGARLFDSKGGACDGTPHAADRHRPPAAVLAAGTDRHCHLGKHSGVPHQDTGVRPSKCCGAGRVHAWQARLASAAHVVCRAGRCNKAVPRHGLHALGGTLNSCRAC